MVERALNALSETGLKLNRNDSRLVTELLGDLARRNRVSPLEIIASSRVQEILTDKKRNAPQRLRRFKEALSDDRYPVYKEAETVFWALIKELDLPPKMKISHSPYFEENWVDVQFRCDHDDDLNLIGESLKKLAASNPVKHALDSAENSC